MIFDNFVGPYRPLSWVFEFWPVAAASLISSLAVTALCKKIAIKFGIVDKPDAVVKTHKEPVAYLGGVGMLVGLVVGVLAAIFILQTGAQFTAILRMLLGILAGAGVACSIGVLDDILDIKPWQKLLGQAIAAMSLLLAGIQPDIKFYLSLFGWQISPAIEMLISIPIVLVFVLGATNSLNLLDGLDGLCGGVTAIIAVAMLFLAAHLATWSSNDESDAVRVVICLALVGSIAGFLPFNRHPAKIFMGDAGSLLLGFIAATLMLLFAERNLRWLLAAMVVFGLPILDTSVAIVRRILNKKPVFVSDRGHIYDQLMDRGHSLQRTVTICYVLAGVYALIGVAMSQIRTRHAVVAYAVVAIISAVIVWKKGFLKMEGHRGAIHKD